jgi:hypothetical protein
MSLAPQGLSVPAGDGRILKGVLNHFVERRAADVREDS